MAAMVYEETFDDGPGGWGAWISNSKGPTALELAGGAVISRSPWWIDYNHAPPGGGYLHMLFSLNTFGGQGEHQREVCGRNRFIEGRFPTDFTRARMTLRLKGELLDRGARLQLLIQGSQGITSPWLLTGQSFSVGEDWSEQSIVLVPDPEQWKCLGSRYDRTDMYGTLPHRDVLSCVNSNLILILYPLTVVPMGPLDGDPHRLRPEQDYPVWRHRLPEGYVMMDSVRIEFASG